MLNLRCWISLAGLLAVTVVQTPSGILADTFRFVAGAKAPLKFEVYQDAAQAYRWRLVSGEGQDRQVLATGGQGYKAKADCMHGVKSIQDGIDKLKFESYEDNAKQNRWRAKASNGQVVGASGSSYKTKADCDGAIEAIKNGVGKATVEEVKPDK
jgi:uncharacterized protein YegP (UPF0339 family)